MVVGQSGNKGGEQNTLDTAFCKGSALYRFVQALDEMVATVVSAT